MKEILLNPFEIIIQENLEHTIFNEYNKFEYYFKNVTTKKVITTLYNHHLIALDGNKLCSIKRALNEDIIIILLENQQDFKDFFNVFSSELYTSKLLDYDNWKKYKIETLDFFTSKYDIAMKDYFNSKKNIDQFALCLENNFNHKIFDDIQYKCISSETKKKLGISC